MSTIAPTSSRRWMRRRLWPPCGGFLLQAAVRPQESRESPDVREAIARAVVQHGWDLREIRLERATLEEFFVQVTADQATAAARKAERIEYAEGGRR